MRPSAVSRNTAASELVTYWSEVPAIGANFGGPAVRMISAGTVATKISGASLAAMTRPGICVRTSAKLASFGNDANAPGSFATGAQGPLTAGADSQPPLSSRYQALVPESKNTSQFVLTANDSGVPVTGTSTGSPSKTT